MAGLNPDKLLAEAAKGVPHRRKLEPAAESRPSQLGLLLGAAANAGRDKITIFTSPEIYDLGAWMEQLIAESTGKQGKGITPVDRETIAAPQFYGKDRIFVYIRYAGTADSSADASLGAKIAAIEAAGHPVVTIEIADLYEIFGQFFTWEVATAVAGSVMGINPFNQPDVESAKIETRALTAAYEQTGSLPEREPVLVTTADGQEFKLYATDAYAATLKAAAQAATLARLSARAFQPDSCRRLFCRAGLSAHVPRARGGNPEPSAQGARLQTRGHLPGLWPALPALHRAGLQGRPQHRRLFADHRGSRRGRGDSGAEAAALAW